MYGEHSTQVVRIFGTSVQTNLEAVSIMLASGLAGSTWLHGALIILGFAVGTGLHLASHWAVAVAFDKGIDRMILTRAGRIDYRGQPPGVGEYVVRTLAGPTMNAVCAVAGYLVLSHVDTSLWPPAATLALRTFTTCSWILAAINFLPAIPLDGGLILQRLIAQRCGELRAQRIAGQISLILTLAMAASGIVWMQPVLIYLGVVMSYDTWRTRIPSATPEQVRQASRSS